MTRQLYELKHPLYPHPDLLRHYQQNNMKYTPYPGSFDDQYHQWYQLVKADQDTNQSVPKRPIYQEVQQIIRLKSASKDYILVAENLIGTDHQNNTIPFFHTRGSYQKPGFRTMYNYDTKTSNTVFSGEVQTVYFIPYDKKELENLFDLGPEDQDIGLYINVGSVQYGGRGFYTYDEFKNLSLQQLAEIGRTGKGMFQQQYTQTPTNELSKELRALGQSVPPSTWHEFQEFQKWKEQSQKQQQQVQSTKSGK